jgi:hypothetical protein
MTKLSINQLSQVTGYIKGEGVSATADKPKAIARLKRVVAEAFGDEALSQILLGCESAVEACKKVDGLKSKVYAPKPEEEDPTMNDNTTAEAPKTEVKKRGRVSAHTGSTLTALVEANPRRTGTKGHASMQIILDAGKAGIKYEDYIAKGGRPNDLAWDIERKSVATSR